MKSNKEKILDAASSLFKTGGVQALSVRAISKEAGLSTIGIYSHFEGKQGILDALYIQAFEYVTQAMDVLGKDLEPRQAMRQAAVNYLDLATKREAHCRLIFGETDDSYEPSREAKTVGIIAFDALTKVAATLLPENASKREQQDVALQIWALLQGSITLKQHVVSELVSMKAWKARALIAVDYLIDGVLAEKTDKTSAT